jgi:glycosyltransferase involved in cell wall biosynthesis
MTQLRKDSSRGSRFVRLLNGLPKPIDHFQTPDSLIEVRNRLQAGRYDLLVSDEICMASYVQGLPGPKLVGRHKVDHMHYRSVAAAQAFGAQKLAQWFDAYELRRYERRLMSEFDAAVCCSEDDAAAIHALNPTVPITVIGNGVDLEYFSPLEEFTGPPTLLYLGTMHYYPNIDAVHYFFQKIHPHLLKFVPGVQVQIVGHEPPSEIRAWERVPGVKIVGSVPDPRPYLAQSTAMIVPLRLGSGTRLKILESLAAARSVVSTSVGAEGLRLRDGEHILLADDPLLFAKQTAALLSDRGLRQRLVAAARPVVAALYSWRVLGERYEALCRSIVERGVW